VLAALARLLPASQLGQLRLIISPRTLLRSHADLVRRHWPSRAAHQGGLALGSPCGRWRWRWPATTQAEATGASTAS